VNAILAAGMTLVILTGGIDLSVGSLHALCGIAAATVLTSPLAASMPNSVALVTATVAALGLGLLLGVVNGGVIAWLRIPPFIVTLAMMRVARGIAKHLTGGTPIGLQGPGTAGWEQTNARWEAFRELGLGVLPGGVPISFAAAILAAALLTVLLRLTRVGRHIFAIGSSEGSAFLAGIPVARVKLLVYALMGLLSGLAGAIEASALQSGSPVTGEGYELNAIAAVVVGGTRLSGGQGGIPGTFIGAVCVIGVMNNALNLKNVPSFWQEVASGAIILAVALVDRFTRARR
jgi:ribose/xylose/arabinose/galactoside ABC-type transport system permease subunit